MFTQMCASLFSEETFEALRPALQNIHQASENATFKHEDHVCFLKMFDELALQAAEEPTRTFARAVLPTKLAEKEFAKQTSC